MHTELVPNTRVYIILNSTQCLCTECRRNYCKETWMAENLFCRESSVDNGAREKAKNFEQSNDAFNFVKISEHIYFRCLSVHTYSVREMPTTTISTPGYNVCMLKGLKVNKIVNLFTLCHFQILLTSVGLFQIIFHTTYSNMKQFICYEDPLTISRLPCFGWCNLLHLINFEARWKGRSCYWLLPTKEFIEVAEKLVFNPFTVDTSTLTLSLTRGTVAWSIFLTVQV